MSLIRGLGCALLGLIATALPALAQQDDGARAEGRERPVIGVVLSGGLRSTLFDSGDQPPECRENHLPAAQIGEKRRSRHFEL